MTGKFAGPLARPILPWVGIACLLLAGCNAAVREFTAEPRHICPGQPVNLRWSIVGSGTLTVTPPNQALPNGPVPCEGKATILPMTTTNVDLHVTRTFGNPTTSRQQIEVKAASDKPEVLAASMGDDGASPGCEDGKVWATVHAKRFAPAVKVESVMAHPGDGRIYEVQHGGVKATVGPGAAASAFSGMPIVGDWLLTTRVGDGKTCRDVPRNLVVDVFTQCMPEASP